MNSLFKEAHQEAFSQINCLDCAHCCSSLGPIIKDKDLSTLSERENLKPADFIKKYLKLDEDGDLVFAAMPCPFLGNDNYCSIYENRPDACCDYPHMNRGRQNNRINLHLKNISFCPAVILAIEELMKITD